MNYDVIVVGGGHAGVEACSATAKMGLKTLLITLNKKMIGNMPCNPSIGGSAKGIVVREIDALGGVMGKAADLGCLQMKMLNTGKGPGVRCLRAQEDKINYPKIVLSILEKTQNLTIIEGMVDDLLKEDHHVVGVKIKDQEYYSKAVILTTGTYMESQILVGHHAFSAGPDGEKPSLGLSPKLQEMGIKVIRLKTGTPPRIKKDSIDFSKVSPETGTDQMLSFSYETKEMIPFKDQVLCHLTYTNEHTHQIIKDNLEKSAMYGGLVTGVGPRYCPSIEDKVIRFSDKNRHQLFLEPESLLTDSIYLQGFSTSMPEDIQLQMVHSLPGLENAEILKYAYAIEYDAIASFEYDSTLMIKNWPGLYIAGQICGTSGYEEAAGLGLIAGINAALRIKNEDSFILRRDEAYIGVMIDDLVFKGTKEPYRLLSSRAEYRLLLRHDNADLRLSNYGYKLGLISQTRYTAFQEKTQKIEFNKNILETTFLGTNQKLVDYMHSLDYMDYKGGSSASNLLKRPLIRYQKLKEFVPNLLDLDDTASTQLEILVKYEGYIEKDKKAAERLKKLEQVKIPQNINYLKLDGLALEARQKLQEAAPFTIGQASRISGVNPSDISVLMMHIKKGVQ